MKKMMFALLAAAVMFAAGAPAMAENADQDVAKITCAELQKSQQSEITLMLMWMDGYMSGKSDNTVMSDEWMNKFATHIKTYCDKNPNNTIMQAMEAIQ